MEYPISIEGRPSGRLTETSEGLYTVFRADCPMRSGLIRLWLHGGGRSACLGLLAPRGDRLVLTRRLSRQARAAFPAPIEFVSDRPAASSPAPSPTPPPKPEASAPGAPDWRALPDGSLIAGDGLRAIPAALPPASPLAAHVRRIEGRDYLVFRL